MLSERIVQTLAPPFKGHYLACMRYRKRTKETKTNLAQNWLVLVYQIFQCFFQVTGPCTE